MPTWMGPRCAERLNGMFAFALWDAKANRLFIARDRYGIKPLYYRYQGGTFLFASEIKSIIQHPDIRVKVCVPALNEDPPFQNVFTDLTLFEGIKLLPPAHTLTLDLGDTGSLRIRSDWDFDFNEPETCRDEREYLEELDRLFQEAVNSQSGERRGVGSYLSGGIDSGSIACIAAQSFRNLKTFTGGFDLCPRPAWSSVLTSGPRLSSCPAGTRLSTTKSILKAGDMERVMPQLIWHMEDLRVGQSYPNFYVARLASKFVKVVLSGAGGDELFAGYPWRYYRAVVNDDQEHYADKYHRYWMRLIPDRLKPTFYQPDIYPGILAHPCQEVFRGVLQGRPLPMHSPEDYVNQSLYLEAKTFLHGLLVVEDKLSMAHGLETRVPFLDNKLVDFATRVPVSMKLRDLGEIVRLNENEVGPKTLRFLDPSTDGKMLLRKAFSQYVPGGYSGGVKQGFSAPDAGWFKGESMDYVKNLLGAREARIYAYLQPEAVHRIMEEHFTGQANRRLLIWSLLCFEWWLRVFLP